MKYLIALLLFSPAFVFAQLCETIGSPTPLAVKSATPEGCLPLSVRLYVDSETSAFWGERLDNWLTHETGLLTDHYDAEDIALTITSEVLDYTLTGNTTGQVWYQFSGAGTGVPRAIQEDAGILLIMQGSGGVAIVQGLGGDYPFGVVSIRERFSTESGGYENSSTLAHELGHIIGSSHSHACIWNQDNTAIDGFYSPEGTCERGPVRESGGFMSYAHLSRKLGWYFYPQVRKVLRANVYALNGMCAPECADTTNFSIVFDSYATEVSWRVGSQSSTPYEKGQAFARETICATCDTLYLTDSASDGLQGGCNTGFVSYQGRTYEFTGESLAIPLCDEPFTPCLDYEGIGPFSNQHGGGQVAINGGEITLSGNTWQSIILDYTITDNSVLTLEVWHDGMGEIHGIALPPNGAPARSRTIQFGGRQAYGFQRPTFPGEWVTHTIRLSQYFTGYAEYLVFVNDGDSGPTGTTKFRNVCIEEQGRRKMPNIGKTNVLGQRVESIIMLGSDGVEVNPKK